MSAPPAIPAGRRQAPPAGRLAAICRTVRHPPDPAYEAARGSFTSAQAVHATAVLRGRYPGFRPPAGLTALVEIVYPENRIVVDHGDLDDLVLLGAVDTATGRSYGLPLPVPYVQPGGPGVVYDPPPEATEVVLVDIDGTVVLMNGRSSYDMTRVGEDSPNPAVIAAVRAMHAAGYGIIYCSGRDDSRG